MAGERRIEREERSVRTRVSDRLFLDVVRGRRLA
jgi:hypothetical protein